MASYAGAYGAGGASDALRQLVADRLVQAKFAEEQRQAQAREAAMTADRQQQAQQFAANQGLQMAELSGRRDERYQDRTLHVEDQNRALQRQALEDQIRAKERTEDVAAKAADRTTTETFTSGENDKNRALQRYIAAQQAAATGGSRELANEMTRLRITGETEKQDQARVAKTKQASDANVSTQQALDSVKRLLNPQDLGANLDAATGAYELRGFTQGAQDFNAERERLIAMLTQPNLGALKGPMSDKDVIFIKQLSSKLANTKMSGAETTTELGRVRDFLQSKMGGGVADGGGMVTLQAPDGTTQQVPASAVDHYVQLGAKVVP